MKIIVITIACVAAILAIFVFRQNATIASQDAQLTAIGAELSALKQQTKSVSLDIQMKCSEQSRKAFIQSGFKTNDQAVYQNHYNAQLKKCFIDVQNTMVKGETIWTYQNVYDAVEGKQYGTYAWHTDPVKKYWEVPPIICEVELLQGEKVQCQSEDEFVKLIQVYMAG